jgi:hypothetical protein
VGGIIDGTELYVDTDVPGNGDEICDDESYDDLPIFDKRTNNVGTMNDNAEDGEDNIVQMLLSDLKSEIKQLYSKFDCRNCTQKKERVKMALDYIRNLSKDIDEDMYAQGMQKNGTWVTSIPQLTKRQKCFHASQNCL